MLAMETGAELAERLRRERHERAIEQITEKLATVEPAAQLDAATLVSAMANGQHALDVLSALAAQMVAAGTLDMDMDMDAAADGIDRLRRIDTGRLTQARRGALARR